MSGINFEIPCGVEWESELGEMNKMDHELGIVEFMILFYFV